MVGWLGWMLSAGAWVVGLEAGRTGQAGSHSPRARNPLDGNGEVDQRLPAPQLPKGRKSKWKLGRLKWSKWEHGKLGLGNTVLIEEVAPSDLKTCLGMDL